MDENSEMYGAYAFLWLPLPPCCVRTLWINPKDQRKSKQNHRYSYDTLSFTKKMPPSKIRSYFIFKLNLRNFELKREKSLHPIHNASKYPVFLSKNFIFTIFTQYHNTTIHCFHMWVNAAYISNIYLWCCTEIFAINV